MGRLRHMGFQEEFAALQARIAKARSERDIWRGSGMLEKYLEAYSAVEALELALDRLLREGLPALVANHGRVPVYTSLPGQEDELLA